MCCLKRFADIVDIEEVKRLLYEDEYPVGKEWLHECKLSLSPLGDHIVLAYKRNMVLMRSKWDSREEVKIKYHSTCCKKLCDQEDSVTAVLCLPLYAHRRALRCSPDWTCIVVGLSSGFVHFYTETGSLLLRQRLQSEPVRALHCHSHTTQAMQPSQQPQQPEQLYVLYHSVVCVLPGSGLFQSLTACRSQLARVKANCEDAVRTPPLVYKKWGFQEQAAIADCQVAGPATSNTFDHLMTTSLSQDFDAFYRSGAPQMSLVLAVGRKPFVGFHYAVEGGAPPPFKDMAMAVASKLKSALGQAVPSWLSGGRRTAPAVTAAGTGEVSRSASDPEATAAEPVEPLLCRFGLCDSLRVADTVLLSPNRTLSAVSDVLGRVLLIDNQKGIVLRMWKGYRNAQCGWLESHEEDSRGKRAALFLAIYSPNMNCLDVWATQRGARVASFSGDETKNGRLVYVNHGHMGLTSVLLNDGSKSQFPVIFINAAGCLKELVVPFHLALSAHDNRHSRDLQQLRELRRLLRGAPAAAEAGAAHLSREVQAGLGRLHTPQAQTHGLEIVAASSSLSPSLLQAVLDTLKIVIELQEPEQECEQASEERQQLVGLHQRLRRLLVLYWASEQPYTGQQATSVSEDMTSAVQVSEQEVENLIKLAAEIESFSNKPHPEHHVTFKRDIQSSFPCFLSCFELTASTAADEYIVLKKNLSEEKLKTASELLCEAVVWGRTPLMPWCEEVRQSCVQPLHAVQLLLLCWLGRRSVVQPEAWAQVVRLAHALYSLCCVAGLEQVCAEYNELSPWWLEVRRMLTESTNPFMAAVAAVACRAVSVALEKDKEMKSGAVGDVTRTGIVADMAVNAGGSEWEKMSRDSCQWTLLTAQLEDLAALDLTLRTRPVWMELQETDEKQQQQEAMCEPMARLRSTYFLPHTHVSLSLHHVLKKGKGSVSELVAQWLSSAGTRPAQLQSDERVEQPLCGLVQLLRERFPHSLAPSTLLANLCWEYVFHWQRSPDRLDALNVALECLRAVPCVHMRHGLCSLVWGAHIQRRLQAAVLLLQRLGRLPQERHCLEQLGFSDLQLPAFLGSCVALLDIFMDAAVGRGAGPPPAPPGSEQLWGCESTGPPPLAEVALAQPLANSSLLLLHWQLAQALHMLAALDLRLSRPVSVLFDATAQTALFCELAGVGLLAVHSPDSRLCAARGQFLVRVVHAAVQTVRRTEPALLDAHLANEWMGRCHALAAVWGVSSDMLRRQHVCELYSCGFDQLAEEVLPAVNDTSLLAAQLLLVAGQRVKHMLDTAHNVQEWVSQLSPSLYRWLKSVQDGSPPCQQWSPQDTAQLLATVLRYVPEASSDHSLALHMLDAVTFAATAGEIGTKGEGRG